MSERALPHKSPKQPFCPKKHSDRIDCVTDMARDIKRWREKPHDGSEVTRNMNWLDLLQDIPLSAIQKEKISLLQTQHEIETSRLRQDNESLQRKNQELESENVQLKEKVEILTPVTHIDDDPGSITLELADWLRNIKNVPTYGVNLIRFSLVAAEIHRKPEAIAANFEAACEKANLDIVEQTDTVASVRRRSRQAFQ